MATYKCRKCGAELTPQADGVTAVCEYCDSVLRLPKVDPALFNRATELRQERKFDQAAALFRQCVSQDPQDPESHWNLLLCKFGVEYVEEKDGTRVPTCNGITYDPITEDEDYLDAIRFADELSARMYAEEGARITAIQQEIIRLANQGESYDVFISYKESDEQGARTEDSVIAQEIYDALEKKGYKVFLSRVTLKGQAGLKYEPIIFSALNSATVMILVGTSNERMEAVWVSNEWKRFLHLMEENREKKLEVVYKDMKRIDLPARLRFMPQRDISAAGRYGWQQDVAYDVDSMIGSWKKEAAPQVSYVRETDEEANERTIRNYYMRSEQILEQGGTEEEAYKFLEQALDIDNQRAETWWRILNLKSDNLRAPNGSRPEPPQEIGDLIHEVVSCATKSEHDQKWKTAVEAYALSWKHTYGEARYRILKRAIFSSDNFSEKTQNVISEELKLVKKYAPPSIAAKAEAEYKQWSEQLPAWNKYKKETAKSSVILDEMCKKDANLNKTVQKMNKNQTKLRQMDGKPVRVGYTTVLALLYIALSPAAFLYYASDSHGLYDWGLNVIGSVILLVLYIVGDLLITSGPNKSNDFSSVHVLNGGVLGFSFLVGLVLYFFQGLFINILAAIYGVKLNKGGFWNNEYTADSIYELMGKFEGFVSLFFKALIVMIILTIVAATYLHIRQSTLKKVMRKRDNGLPEILAGIDRNIEAFCAPYVQQFGEGNVSVDQIAQRVKNDISFHYKK